MELLLHQEVYGTMHIQFNVAIKQGNKNAFILASDIYVMVLLPH